MLNSNVSVLTQRDMDTIHGSALRVLSQVGARVHHERMCSLLSDFGAEIRGEVVRFPEKLVEFVVDRMRDSATQDPGYTAVLPLNWARIPRDTRVVPVATGQATMAHDLGTDELRPATTTDLVQGCRLCDSLPDVVTGHPLYLPQDRPAMVRDLYALVTVAENYPYSDFVEIFSPELVPDFLEAGRVICGSDEALRQAPPFCSWAFVTPPLQFGRHGLEIALQLKDFGLKRGYGVAGSMPVLGASTPVTLAGYLTSQTAEILAANVINWALTGRTSGYSGGPTVLDFHLMTPSAGSAEAVLLLLACMDLQRYYGNTDPVFPYAMGTDAKFPDVQAGMEKGLKSMLAVLAGSRLLSAGIGCLSLSGVVSLAQLVIDYDLCRQLDHFLKGIPVDGEHIALDLILNADSGSSFLAQEHTVRHMRESLSFSPVADRRTPDQWRKDRRGMLEHAKDRVGEILRNDAPPGYLDREQVTELHAIADRAAARY